MENFTIGIIKPSTLRRGDDKGVLELMSLAHFTFLSILKKDITSCKTTFEAFSTSIPPDKKEEYRHWWKGSSLLMVLTHPTYDPVERWKEVMGHDNPYEASAMSIRGMYSGAARAGKNGHPYDDVVYGSRDKDRAFYDLDLLFPKHVVEFVRRK